MKCGHLDNPAQKDYYTNGLTIEKLITMNKPSADRSRDQKAYEAPLANLLSKHLVYSEDSNNPTAFYSAQPDSIRCSKSVEDFKNGKIDDISLTTFLQTNQMKRFTSSNTMNADLIKKVWLDKKHPKLTMTEFEKSLFDKNFNNQFVVTQMVGALGAGIFLAPDAKKIALGEVVMLYAGEYSGDSSNNSWSDYFLHIDPTFDHERKSILLDIAIHPRVDNKVVGNLSRFIQHAPDEMEMATQVKDPDNIKSKVATASLQQRVGIYQGFPCLYLQAGRDINPGEQLTFSYGSEYFNLRGGCVVFNDKAKIIGTLKNNTLKRTCSAAEIKAMPKATRMNVKLFKAAFFKPLCTVPTIDFATQFTTSVIHALEVSTKMYANNEKIKQHLGEVMHVFTKADSGAEQYDILREQLNFRKFTTELMPLRKHLMSEMAVFREAFLKTKSQVKQPKV